MRKYEISCNVVIQAISQLKQHYKDSWNTIAGNCDTKIFLGSDDNETIKWLIETTGKHTVRTASESYQTKGGGSTSFSTAGEDLITPDCVTMLDENDCIVRIRGLPIYQGPKFKTFNHPEFKYAMATKGKFHVQNHISEQDELSRLPLWKRNELKAKGKIAQTAASSEDDAVKPKEDDKKKKAEETRVKAEEEKARQKIERTRNLARKEDADKAKKTLEEKAVEQGMKENVKDFDPKELLDTFGIDLDDTEEDIAKKLDSEPNASLIMEQVMSIADYTLSQ